MSSRESNLAQQQMMSGEAYEPLTGRWSRLIAPRFLEWLDVSAHSRWLDVGCGTGALIQAMLDHSDPAEVVGVDSSSSFIAYARKQINDPRVRYEVGDARGLPVASNQYDAVAAGLVLNHVPPPAQLTVVREMTRAARTGGVAGAYVWDYAGGFEPRARFWEAAVALDPDAARIDERTRYPICQPEALARLFRNAQLHAVETTKITVPAVFSDFNDYWQPFLAGYGPASTYALNLPSERLTALQERLRETLPVEPDGSIPLEASAWAVKGVR